MKHLRTYNLAVQFFREVKTTQLPCHLKDQLMRASSSIVLNLAEGTGRRTMKDQRKFFYNAFGSTKECQAIIEIFSEQFTAAQIDLADHIAASIYNLIKKAGV